MAVRLKFFQSLRGKLFLVMSAVVILTIAGNTWQNGKRFGWFLERQIEDVTLMQARESARSIESYLESLISQSAFFANTLASTRRDLFPLAAESFVATNPDFVSLQLLSRRPGEAPTQLAFAFTKERDKARFENQSADDVSARMAAYGISDIAKKPPGAGSVIFNTLAPSTKLPIMSLAMSFSLRGGNEELWAVLTTWQTGIITKLPTGASLSSLLINNKGRVFTSPDAGEMQKGGSVRGLELTKVALSGASPYGFRGRYKDRSGKTWLGAFASIPQLGLTVLVQKDAETAYLQTKHIVQNAALYGLLFVLIAGLVSYLTSNSITRNLLNVVQATQKIAAGDFDFRLRPPTRDEVGILTVAVNHMSIQLQRLMSVQIEKARYEKELETARMVQSTFFPKPADESASDGQPRSLSIAGYYQPAAECGGDWWGHYQLENGEELVCIADAMGHGLPSAMVTAMAYSSFMTFADVLREQPQKNSSPAEILERFNRVLYDALGGTMSVTFFAAVFNKRTGLITYANAGHNFPIILPANENDPRTAKSKDRSLAKIAPITHISLSQMGSPLGLVREAIFEESSIQMIAGDKVILYTDGLTEGSSPQGKQWGRKSMLKAALALYGESAAAIRDGLLGRAYNHFGEQPLADDITVVVVEVDKNYAALSSSSPLPLVQDFSLDIGDLKVSA